MPVVSDDEEDVIAPVPVPAPAPAPAPLPAKRQKSITGMMFGRKKASTSFSTADTTESPAAPAPAPAPAPAAVRVSAIDTVLEAATEKEVVAPIPDAADAADAVADDAGDADDADDADNDADGDAEDAGDAEHGAFDGALDDSADSDDGADFGGNLSNAPEPMSRAEVVQRVNETEALMGIESRDDAAAAQATAQVGTAATAAAMPEMTQDFVEEALANASESEFRILMRGSKKNNKATIAVDLREHMEHAGLKFAHLMVTAPTPCPDEVEQHIDDAADGVRLIKPFVISDPTLFLGSRIDQETDKVNALVEESDAAAVGLALSLVVVFRDASEEEGASGKRQVGAFTRVSLSDSPSPCDPKIKEYWGRYYEKMAAMEGTTELVMSINQTTAQRLCKHPVAAKFVPETLRRCFATTKPSRKKAGAGAANASANLFKFARFCDDTKAAVVLSAIAERVPSDKKRSGGSSSGSRGDSKRNRSSSSSGGAIPFAVVPTKEAPAPEAAAPVADQEAAPEAQSEPPAQPAQPAQPAPSATALVVHNDDEEMGACPQSEWLAFASGAHAFRPPFAGAALNVYLPVDQTKVSLVTCGTGCVMLQITK